MIRHDHNLDVTLIPKLSKAIVRLLNSLFVYKV
jgi:hypothetical protein